MILFNVGIRMSKVSVQSWIILSNVLTPIYWSNATNVGEMI